MASLQPGNRGGKVLVHAGYRYQKNRRRPDKIYWRCWRKTCHAFIQTSAFDINEENPHIRVLQVAKHNHPYETKMITTGALKQKMVEVIEADPSKSVKSVYDEVVKTVEGCDQVPNFTHVRTKLSRKRASLLPSSPQNDEFVFENEGAHIGLQQHAQDNRTHQGSERGVLVFGTDINFAKLSKCQEVYINSPRPFEQSVTIYGKYLGKIMPLVTCLMTGRTCAQYTHLMSHLRNKVRQVTGYRWRPRRIVTANFTSSHLQNTESKLLDVHRSSDCGLTPQTKLLDDVQQSAGCELLYSTGAWRRAWALGISGPFCRHGNLRRCTQRVTSHGCQFSPGALEQQNIRNLDSNRTTTPQSPGLADILEPAESNSIMPSPSLCCVFDRRLSRCSNNVAQGFRQRWQHESLCRRRCTSKSVLEATVNTEGSNLQAVEFGQSVIVKQEEEEQYEDTQPFSELCCKTEMDVSEFTVAYTESLQTLVNEAMTGGNPRLAVLHLSTEDGVNSHHWVPVQAQPIKQAPSPLTTTLQALPPAIQPTLSTPALPAAPQPSPLDTPASRGPTETERQIISQLGSIRQEVDGLKQEMGVIKQLLLSLTSRNTTNTPPEGVHLPIATLHELLNTEDLLEEEATYNEMVKYLETIRGADASSNTRRILIRLLTTSLAQQLSWRGSDQKLSFKDLRINRAILDAVTKTSGATATDVETTIRIWLINAKRDRDGERTTRMRLKR